MFSDKQRNHVHHSSNGIIYTPTNTEREREREFFLEQKLSSIHSINNDDNDIIAKWHNRNVFDTNNE